MISCYGNMALVVGFNNEKWSNFVRLLKLLKHQLLYMLWLSINTICAQSVTPRSPNQHCSGCAEHLWARSQSSLDTTLTDSSKQCHPAWQLPYTCQNPSIVKSKPIRFHFSVARGYHGRKTCTKYLVYIISEQVLILLDEAQVVSKVTHDNSRLKLYQIVSQKASLTGLLMLTLPVLPCTMHKITKYLFFEVHSDALNIMLQVMNEYIFVFVMSFSDNTESKCLNMFNGAKSPAVGFCLFGTQQCVYVNAPGFTPQHIPAWPVLHTLKNKPAPNLSRPTVQVCILTSWQISSSIQHTGRAGQHG